MYQPYFYVQTSTIPNPPAITRATAGYIPAAAAAAAAFVLCTEYAELDVPVEVVATKLELVVREGNICVGDKGKDG